MLNRNITITFMTIMILSIGSVHGELSFTRAVTFSGPSGTLGSYGTISSLGDINGDGFNDFGWATGDSVNGGFIFNRFDIYYGGAVFDTLPALTIRNYGGYPAIGSLDFNGDGYPDLALKGHLQADPTSPAAIFLFLGNSTGLDTVPSLTFRLGYGEAGTAYYGWALAAGDVNGDGFDDLLVSAPVDSQQNSGRVDLYLGQPTIANPVDTIPDWTFTGTTESRLGVSLEAADLNNDGYCDFAVGAINAPGGGTIYFFEGGDTIAENPTLEITSPSSSIHFTCQFLYFAPNFGNNHTLLLTDAIDPYVMILDSAFNIVGGYYLDYTAPTTTYGYDLGFKLGHFNGDGVIDAIAAEHVRDGSYNNTFFIYTELSDTVEGHLASDASIQLIDFNTNLADAYNVIPIDLNGDGYDELLATGYGPDGQLVLNIFTFNGLTVVGVDDTHGMVSYPTDYRLLSCYPNPFNNRTLISFELAKPTRATLSIYNLLGEEVARLANKQQFSPGRHRLVWDARGMPSGVYLARLAANGHSRVSKLVLLK